MAAKKSRRKTTAKKPDAWAFVVSALQKNPDAAFAPLRDAAAKKKLVLYPIVYGRAKAYLGLVPVKKRGSKKKAAKRGPGRPPKRGPGRPPKRGPGRPRKTADSSLEGIVQQISEMQKERDRLHRTLSKIRTLLDDVI